MNSDPSIYNGSVAKCSIKPTRNGHGVTNIMYLFRKKAYDIRLQVKLSYKFPTGTKFLPWMGNFDVDVCKVMEIGHNISTLAELAMKSALKNAGNLIHKCPYYGEEGLKNGDMQDILSEILPQIIPKGIYGIFMRFHISDNRTYLTLFFTVEVDAVNPLKSFHM